jgi:nitroimidazol reductase NimA-like FMN-containing flavoprotein (pyridoxamine 5'-phosphate oxidase superfamily)
MTVEQLQEFGMERMTDDDIEGFLQSEGTGVLALPQEGTPYVLPLSFGYDGGTSLYFTYIVSGDSRKVELSERADTACFLAYRAESAFNWRSVVSTGRLSELPTGEWDDHADAILDNAWHPALFDDAIEGMDIRVFQLVVDEWSGFRHAGIPPGFSRDDRG